MSDLRCPTCGEMLKFINIETGYVCDYCGYTRQVTNLDEGVTGLLNTANEKRNDYNFVGAKRYCDMVLNQDVNNQLANWCALLAEYKVIYLKNNDGEYAPTFLDAQADQPMTESEYYKRLDPKYQREADDIENMRLIVEAQSRTIKDYHVFISYKQHDESGRQTIESDWAKSLYEALNKKHGEVNLKIFYDVESLKGKNAGWEPHIYAALKSAKVMVLLASSLDNLNSTWVKNEWKRFVAFKKPIIVVAPSTVDPKKLPKLGTYQAQIIDPTAGNWKKDTINRVFEAINSRKDLSYLLYEANNYITKNNFKRAQTLYKQAEEMDSTNFEVYWGLLRCKLKAFDDYDIVASKKKLVDIPEFNSAMDHADDVEKERLSNIQKAQLNASMKKKVNTNDFPRENYNAWLKWSKPKRVAKKFAVAVLCCGVVAFGVYSAAGIINPVSYKIEYGTATLSGTSMYYGMVVKDLTVDTFNDYPVTSIADGALKNGGLQTVTFANSVKTIGDEALANNKKLTSVTIGSSNIKIGNNAFKNCVNLKEVQIGSTTSSVKSANSKVAYVLTSSSSNGSCYLGSGAFENCASLESLYLENCTYIGANAFSGCDSLISLTINVSDDATVETGAFANIGSNVKINIPSVSETLLNKLQGEYPATSFGTYTRDSVEECIYVIAKLKTVDGNSGAELKKAEELYNKLTSAQKSQITNYGILQNATKAYEVAVKIKNIGQVTLDSATAISNAEEAYALLNEEQKAMLGNYATLKTAKEVFNVMSLIDKIDKIVTIDSQAGVELAESAYNALSYENRDLVLNYDVLTEARSAVDTIYAKVVIALINNIGTVNLDSDSLITAAEAGFKNLTESQQEKVTNYSTLTDARTIYNVMKDIDSIGEITKDKLNAISKAENLYNSLTAAQKSKISNYNELVDARAVYEVVVLIDALGTVYIDSFDTIETAESSYAKLTPTQQEKVTNYSKLIDTRTIYSVVELIDKIGAVATLESKADIDTAQAAYNLLNDSQKGRVGNYSMLTSATKVYDCLNKIDIIGNVSLSSESAIVAAEKAYGVLSDEQKTQITSYGTLTYARGLYNLMTTIQDLDNVYLGIGTNYKNFNLNSSNISMLNDKESCQQYDSLTVTGLPALSVSSWQSVFGNLNKIRYDVTKKVTVEKFKFTALENISYEVIGSNDNVSSVAMTSDSGSLLYVTFNNFQFTSSSTALDFSTVDASNITFSGTCSIKSGTSCDAIKGKYVNIQLVENSKVTINAGNGNVSNGGNGIYSTQLSINGDVSSSTTSLQITGGNAGNATSGNAGYRGGDAIWSTSVFIYTTGYVVVKGGVGGAGGSCKTSYSVTDYGSANRNGSDGLAGGAGGSAVNADSLTIASAGKFEFTGGAGGSGSSGGNGGGSNDDGNAQAGYGGKGGNGGAGGSGIKLTSTLTVSNDSASITTRAGAGGNGGQGGEGGEGKNDNRRDNGGAGGKGGNGGNSGYCVYAKDSSLACKIVAIAGAGGKGGNGNYGGAAHKDYSITPKCGAGGDGGDGGDSCVVSGVNTSNLSITYASAGNGGDGGKSGAGGGDWLATHNPTKAKGGKGGTGGDIIVNGNVVKYGSSGKDGTTDYSGSGGAGGAGASY